MRSQSSACDSDISQGLQGPESQGSVAGPAASASAACAVKEKGAVGEPDAIVVSSDAPVVGNGGRVGRGGRTMGPEGQRGGMSGKAMGRGGRVGFNGAPRGGSRVGASGPRLGGKSGAGAEAAGDDGEWKTVPVSRPKGRGGGMGARGGYHNARHPAAV